MTNTTGKTKAVNYSQAMLDTMATMYTGADNKAEVAAIAKKLGKTAGSVRAKLSQLGVYEVAAKTATASTIFVFPCPFKPVKQIMFLLKLEEVNQLTELLDGICRFLDGKMG